MKPRIRYLIVEDDPAWILIVRHLLMKSGFDVEYNYAKNKQQVEYYLLNRSFDLIISDHQMPSFTSFDVLEARNRIMPDISFIILSMDMQECLHKKAYELGCSVIINKSKIDSLPWMVKNLFIKKGAFI